MKRLVYICSPLRGDIERNITKAQGYCREAINFGVIPLAPHVYFTQFLNDLIPKEREIGMALGIELLKKCDEVWVYGAQSPSEGMKAEIQLALEFGIKVRDITEVYSIEEVYAQYITPGESDKEVATS